MKEEPQLLFKGFKKRNKWDNFCWWIRHGIWTYLSDIPNNVKWFIQRGKRGYADCDIWNFDCHLADMIYHGLKNLKINKHGYASTPDPVTGEWGYNEDRWDEVMNKLVSGFELAHKCLNGEGLEYGGHLTEESRKRVEEGYKSNYLGIRFTTKEEEAKISEAFDLFKIYFWNLWD